MRRNVVFGKGRAWRVDDNQVQDLRLQPGSGAAVGEYAYPESSEYSDSYYGPGRAGRQGGREGRQEMRGVVGEFRPVHSRNRIGPSYFGSGEIHRGERSWADLGVSSVHPGDSGITEAREPSFRGRGPKSYRRSDERIRENVCEYLTEDPHLDASDIEVEVKDGEVTLTGFVQDRRAKRYAEELAEAASGGAQVMNRLRVRSRL